MNTLRYLLYIFMVALLSLCTSCKTHQFIPVETIKIEYRDKISRDSIFLYDSVFVKQKGDTLLLERYRFLYKDKIVKDSIFITDTIQVPYPVEVVKQVKTQLSGWQNFQVWTGRITLALAALAIISLKLKKRIIE